VHTEAAEVCWVQGCMTACCVRVHVQHVTPTLPDHGDHGGGADEVDQAAEERLGAQVAIVLLGMLGLHNRKVLLRDQYASIDFVIRLLPSHG
jgi:hypothetical protein